MVWNQSVVENTSSNQAQDSRVQQALKGVVIDGETLYANPFGNNDPRIIDYMRVQAETEATFSLYSWDFTATGPTGWQLPGGEVSLAFGTEARHEEVDDNKDPLNEAGELIGGRESTSYDGGRDVFAGYVELALPVSESFELQVAARYEHYSDFGDILKPKIAFSWRPVPWFLLRGSYGQSFLAPNLAYLYAESIITFQDNVYDPVTDTIINRLENRGGGNPDLRPEETESYLLGVAFSPVGWTDKISFAITVSHFDQKNLINRLTPDFLLANEDLFPGQVVREVDSGGNPGDVLFVRTQWQNLDDQTARFWDFSIRTDPVTTPFGNFDFSVFATYLQSFELNGAEFAGEYNNPRWRGSFNMGWGFGSWTGNLFVSYIGAYDNQSEDLVPGDVNEDVRVNLTFTYTGFKDTRITVGARNLFDARPPFDPNRNTGYNDQVSTGEGRYLFVAISKQWSFGP